MGSEREGLRHGDRGPTSHPRPTGIACLVGRKVGVGRQAKMELGERRPWELGSGGWRGWGLVGV